jgi:hypothetical protein
MQSTKEIKNFDAAMTTLAANEASDHDNPQKMEKQILNQQSAYFDFRVKHLFGP